ncbi:hypothetical protein [Kutzneria chonburiensis]|uniref:Uncharacterized protein n=1 Tax=Kutzneria chonburiensis TaxID=1483604 RepID=A0ABV6MNR1_9PSEU|nr:hypothetical protein [Kutzneria chonburiensis]
MAEEKSAPGQRHAASGLPGVNRRGRITVLRRLFLRRQGKTDGRLRKPDPLFVTERQATPMRRRLLVELDKGLSVVAADHAQRVRSLNEHSRKVTSRTMALTDELSAAANALTSVEASAPDPTAPPEYRPGDERHPDDRVRARRMREHERAVNRARAHHRGVQEALTASLATQADLRARIEQLRTEAASEAAGMRALVMAQQALYDTALLRRHPDAELLRRLLDAGEPDLSTWLGSLSSDDIEEAS